MTYSVNNGHQTKLRNFIDMTEEYLEICANKELPSYDVARVMDDVWGKTMEEWGWDVTEFLAQLITVYENRD